MQTGAPAAAADRARTRGRTGRGADRSPSAARTRGAGPALPATHPAWGVAVLGAGGAVVCEIALVLRLVDGDPVVPVLTTGLFVAGAAAGFLLLVLRGVDRWRSWMTHAAVATGEVSLVLMVLRAGDPVTAITFATLFSWAAALVGLYLSARMVVAHVVLLVVAALGALVSVLGAGTALQAMAVLSPVFAGIAAVCARLASLLRQQSTRDTLTGLLNRRGLEGASTRCAEAASRTGQDWCVVAIDLDGFKAVNDRFGHAEGDLLLRGVAHAWRTALREDDVLSRAGGDEFVVLLAGDPVEAAATVDRLRERTPPEVGVSAGVATWQLSLGMDEALRRADAALYRAKRSGRGCTATAGPR